MQQKRQEINKCLLLYGCISLDIAVRTIYYKDRWKIHSFMQSSAFKVNNILLYIYKPHNNEFLLFISYKHKTQMISTFATPNSTLWILHHANFSNSLVLSMYIVHEIAVYCAPHTELRFVNSYMPAWVQQQHWCHLLKITNAIGKGARSMCF